MKGYACQYAVISFLPYAETGEFANVGVVLACPETGYLGARLMPRRRTGRVAAFFDQLDKRVFREAMAYLETEIERVRLLVRERGVTGGPRFVLQLFEGLTRAREALLRCGETRAVLATDPEEKLDVLYARLVEREFADKTYHDQLLERGVREILQRAQLRNLFDRAEIGNDDLHVSLPFVHSRGGRPVLAIKPLDLARDLPNKVYDTGGHWVDRIGRLKRHGLLPDRVLFAVRRPDKIAGGAIGRAANEIVGDLRNLSVVVEDADDSLAIRTFAEPAGASA